MPKFRLSVDETRNTLKYVEIDTQLSEIELDALLTKIEKIEITSTEALTESLEAHNVKVTNITSAEQAYYTDAATLEIEELKETKKQGFMINCKICDLNKENIEQAIEAAREKMIASIDENGTQASITIQLSQELDTLIVADMKKATKIPTKVI